MNTITLEEVRNRRFHLIVPPGCFAPLDEKPMKDWCIYLVECSDGSLYCGITNNLQKRLQAHNAGKGARYTTGRRPVVLVASRGGLTHSEAARREYEVKQRPKKDKFFL